MHAPPDAPARPRRPLPGARFLVLALGVLLTIGAGVAAWRALHLRDAESTAAQRRNAMLFALDSVESGVALAETSYRGYLLTGDPAYLTRGRPGPQAARQGLRRATVLAAGEPRQRARLAALTPLVDAKLTHMARVVRLAVGGDQASALALVRSGRGEALSRGITRQLADAAAEERRLLAVHAGRQAAAARRLGLALAMTAVGALLTVVAGFLISRQETRRTRLALAAADRDRRRLAAVLDALPVGVVIADADGRVLSLSGTAGGLWPLLTGGRSPTRTEDYALLPGRARDTGLPLTTDEWPLVRTLRDGAPHVREVEFRPPDGTPVVVLIAAAPVRDAEGRVTGAVAVWTDLSERIALEERLRQAQRMQAIGQLAGGVAHDFNNLLTVIGGNLEFVRTALADGLPDPVQVRSDLDEIAHATERARTLVRQLLAFSRKQHVQPRHTTLGAVVHGAERLLRRVIGEEIVLAVHVGDDGALVHADPGHLEQVLVNLAVNARDAMLMARNGHPGTGGTLEVEVDTVTLTADDATRWEELASGRYARLLVRDTGHGMDADTRERAFEPFFTTKEVGAGTGLGLATVHGIVRQAGGAVRVESALGVGTTFTVLLPVVEGPAGGVGESAARGDGTRAPAVGLPARAATPRVGDTVLLVEDEGAVRAAARRILERHGYAVHEARHGVDALLVWRQHRDAVDVVVTDVRMPELGGPALVAELRLTDPELPVVFMSGYADGGLAPDGPRDAFVPKPFTPEALLAAVARVRRGGRTGRGEG